MSSRLERIRSKRAGKQGVRFLVLAIILVVITIFWGLPALARLAGNLISTDSTQVTKYELKPTPPIISDIPEATHSATVAINGYAQPGIDVVMYLNGAEIGRKLTSESGTFSFQNVPISSGDNSVYAYTATPQGLMSEKSKEYTITLDNEKPTVTLDSPKDGEVMRGTSQRIATFVGGVNEEGAKVYIGERMAILTSEGKFNLPYQLIEGDQEVVVKAVDAAGNESVTTIKLRWEP